MKNAKSLAVAQHILELAQQQPDPSLTPMQLLKLVYIAHGYMLGKHGRPLLDEPVEAWQYGPVVPSVYHAVKECRSAPVGRVPGARPYIFDAQEQDVMERVAKTYSSVNGTVLSSATHRSGTPWDQTWSRFGRNAQISNDIIESFYADLLAKPTHSAL